jgi:protocatechuate 3,4-dioxygenase beta subunit
MKLESLSLKSPTWMFDGSTNTAMIILSSAMECATMSTRGGYRRDAGSVHPPNNHQPYESTRKRAPMRPPIQIEQTLSEVTGPRPRHVLTPPDGSDLTRFNNGLALGERIIVTGRVLDEDGRPIPDTTIEIWQANAAGRYAHEADQHDAPLDPHFNGVGRVITNREGVYRFITIRPGAYPWRNH